MSMIAQMEQKAVVMIRVQGKQLSTEEDKDTLIKLQRTKNDGQFN